MTRHTFHATLCGAAWLTALAGPARGADGPEVVVLRAIRSNPVVAPYNLITTYRDGKVTVSGVVGTKQIHDLAIRAAIATGYPIRDSLTIDTGAAQYVSAAQAQAALQAQAQAAAAANAGMGIGGTYGGGAGAAAIPSLGYATGNVPYVYPPPLFGRIDDPFFGFEPPLLTYPPWWGAVVSRAQAGATPNPGPPAGIPLQNPQQQGAAPYPAPSQGANQGGALPSAPISLPLGASPQDGAVEMTINPGGVAVLRGVVPTLADRIAIGQQIARTPGVSGVLNLLQVQGIARSGPEVTPLPPQPAPPPGTTIQSEPAPRPRPRTSTPPTPTRMPPTPGRSPSTPAT